MLKEYLYFTQPNSTAIFSAKYFCDLVLNANLQIRYAY